MTNSEKLPEMGPTLLAKALLKRANRNKNSANYSRSYRLGSINIDHMNAYRSSLGFVSHEIPITYFYLLSQRFQLATMLDDEFRHRIIGIVHTENYQCVFGEPKPDQEFEIVCDVDFEPPTESGTLFATFDVSIKQPENFHQQCKSRYLIKRGKKRGKRTEQQTPAQRPDSVVREWKLQKDSGVKYAQVSGDWNPIHLWRWSSRLMGFDRPIIHGMHTVGRVTAEIETQALKPIKEISSKFLNPIQLGREARLAFLEANRSFEVYDEERFALQGQFAFENDLNSRSR